MANPLGTPVANRIGTPARRWYRRLRFGGTREYGHGAGENLPGTGRTALVGHGNHGANRMGMVDPELDPMRPPPMPRAVLHFSAISEAWDLVLAQWRVWAQATLIAVVGYSIVAGFAYQ